MCGLPWRPLHTGDRLREGISSNLIGGKVEPVHVRFTPCVRDQHSRWMQDGIPTWRQMDHVSWSLWLFLKTTSWEVGLTQNHWETTMSLRINKTTSFFNYIMCKDPAWSEIHWKLAFGREPGHIWLHTTLEGSWSTLHDFGGVLERPFDTSFGPSPFHGHISSLMWSGPWFGRKEGRKERWDVVVG